MTACGLNFFFFFLEILQIKWHNLERFSYRGVPWIFEDKARTELFSSQHSINIGQQIVFCELAKVILNLNINHDIESNITVNGIPKEVYGNIANQHSFLFEIIETSMKCQISPQCSLSLCICLMFNISCNIHTYM